jgi:RNA 2',3'-cyclic 3'-phosphodiesterase
MRVFVALDIDEAIRQRLANFQQEMRALDPNQKWVGVDTFHITLKFIGEQAPPTVEELKNALAEIEAAPVAVEFREAGFFPNPRSPRVFWAGIHGDENLAKLAWAVEEVTSRFGIEREREFKPHLTLARARLDRGRMASGSPHQRTKGPASAFAGVAKKLSAMPAPEFGTMTASEFFLYESKLSPHGAAYTKIARFGLR